MITICLWAVRRPVIAIVFGLLYFVIREAITLSDMRNPRPLHFFAPMFMCAVLICGGYGLGKKSAQ